jgi:phosphoenolpyruvate carboxylase
LLADISNLYSELAICRGFSSAMLELAAEVKNSTDNFEKYRRVLGHLKRRLAATIKWCEKELSIGSDSPFADKNILVVASSPNLASSSKLAPGAAEDDEVLPIFDKEDLLRPLKIMHESLMGGGYEDVADGLLVDVIRRVATFGTTMVPLDIRQESTKHMNAIDAVTRHLGELPSLS